MKKALLIGSFICFYSSLFGQIITDRPDQTESSSTVPRGSLQIESGIVLSSTGDSLSNRQWLLPTNLFRYGITKNIELRLLNQYEMNRTGETNTDGFSDLEIGTKIQLYRKEGAKTEAAFLTHLVFPSGSEPLYASDYGSISKLSIAHDINENFSIGYNLGYNYFGTGSGDFTYSLAMGIAINDKAGIYFEPFGEYQNMEEFVLNFDGGLTYLLNDNLQLDFSFGTGATHRMNYLSVGCSWLIEKK